MVEPVSDALLESQVHPPVCLLVDADGEVASLVQQLDGLHLRQLDGKDELAHLGDPAGALLEALEKIPRQDEIPLLPSGEDLVSLLPQQPLLQGQVCLDQQNIRRSLTKEKQSVRFMSQNLFVLCSLEQPV